MTDLVEQSEHAGAPARPAARASMLDAVVALRRDVAATVFPLEIDGVTEARASQQRLLDQLDQHLLPRLRELSAPAVVVVAGSTGAGKSTIVNSLVGAEVSAAGVLRPTTRQPVLIHNPADAELLASHPLMEAVVVVSHPAVPRGLALLDAPDVDSVVAENRIAAHQLLEAADLWLFVTTAARYGDALPWQVLDYARQRGMTMAMVLNRVQSRDLAPVRADLLRRLREREMSDVALFTIDEFGPHEGLLGEITVAPIARWLSALAGPDQARTVITRTLRGALQAVRPWTDELADAVQAQVDTAARLRAEVEASLAGPEAEFTAAVVSGAIADGAVRARFAELRSERGALAGLVTASGRVHGSRRTGRARAEAVAPLLADLELSVGSVLLAADDAAARAVREHLRGELPTLDASTAADAGAALPTEAQVRQAAEAAVAAVARAWVEETVAEVDRVVATSPALDRRRRSRLAAAVGPRATGAVVLAAAAGVGEAAAVARALLGQDADSVVESAVADLLRRLRAELARVATTFTAALQGPAFAEDAAATLRLRLAVLKDVA